MWSAATPPAARPPAGQPSRRHSQRQHLQWGCRSSPPGVQLSPYGRAYPLVFNWCPPGSSQQTGRRRQLCSRRLLPCLWSPRRCTSWPPRRLRCCQHQAAGRQGSRIWIQRPKLRRQHGSRPSGGWARPRGRRQKHECLVTQLGGEPDRHSTHQRARHAGGGAASGAGGRALTAGSDQRFEMALQLLLTQPAGAVPFSWLPSSRSVC